MKAKSRSAVILSVLFGYIILQFLWWEVLLVRQNSKIINENQKILELTTTNETQLRTDIAKLHEKKTKQTWMIVGEGTVFLLLLLFGLYRIKQAQEKEDQLTRQQENFFLSITHELKTPIAATKLQLQTLQKQQLSADIQKELIAGALLENERLNMLIDNVLVASRLETGEFIFKKDKTNLSNLIHQIVNRYYKTAIQNGELKVFIDDDIFCEVDEHYFPSVVTNLIDNAFKYSKEEKNIEIRLSKKNNKALLSVSDTGVGISDTDKEKVFAKFYRAGNEETRSSKGTGLGLYIVKYIINKHGATIAIKNNIHSGSIFEIEFEAA